MDPLRQAKAFVAEGRDDLAAVFFAAASQAPGLNEAQRSVARRNAALLATKLSERTWGACFAEFLDDPRHEAVCKAIAEYSEGGRHVLMLGSALGMYALAAKRGGASKVVCVESSGFFEYAATAVVRAFELEGVEVLMKRVEDPDLQARVGFDVLVATELLWGSCLSTSGVRTLSSAMHLMATGAKVIPQTAVIYAQAMHSDTLRDQNWLSVDSFIRESGLDYSEYNLHARRSRRACHLSPCVEHRPLSDAYKCISLNFQEALDSSSRCIDVAAESMRIQLEACGDGVVQCIATWTSLGVSAGGHGVSWGPGSRGGIAWQFCHFLDISRAISAGERIDIDLVLGSDGVRLAGPSAPGDDCSLSPYHTSMLSQDPQRTSAYRLGIQSAVKSMLAQQRRQGEALGVLDIGAGTGLLSMFAAGAGAKVVACERDASTAALAQRLVEANGLAGSIRIVQAKSSEVSFDGEGMPPRLVISEIFGSDPLSEGVLAALKGVEQQFKDVETSLAFLPCQCRLWGSLARVPASWGCRSEEASACGVDFGRFLAPFEMGTVGNFLVDLRHEFSHVEVLTEPEVLAVHSFTSPIAVSGSCSAALPLLPEPRPLSKFMAVPEQPGQAESWVDDVLCLVMWFDADCSLEPQDGETRISTSPAVERGAHWVQFAHVLPDDAVDEMVWDAVASCEGTISIETKWQLDLTSFRVGLVSP